MDATRICGWRGLTAAAAVAGAGGHPAAPAGTWWRQNPRRMRICDGRDHARGLLSCRPLPPLAFPRPDRPCRGRANL
jgi:hypothetical protein